MAGGIVSTGIARVSAISWAVRQGDVGASSPQGHAQRPLPCAPQQRYKRRDHRFAGNSDEKGMRCGQSLSKSAAAPATVSGECLSQYATDAARHWEGGFSAMTREPGDLPVRASP